jgi:hypothetical protein
MRPRTLWPIVAGERRSFTAFTLQTKIAKIVVPSKTRVHAIEVANHNASYFMACTQAAPARWLQSEQLFFQLLKLKRPNQ